MIDVVWLDKQNNSSNRWSNDLVDHSVPIKSTSLDIKDEKNKTKKKKHRRKEKSEMKRLKMKNKKKYSTHSVSGLCLGYSHLLLLPLLFHLRHFDCCFRNSSNFTFFPDLSLNWKNCVRQQQRPNQKCTPKHNSCEKVSTFEFSHNFACLMNFFIHSILVVFRPYFIFSLRSFSSSFFRFFAMQNHFLKSQRIHEDLNFAWFITRAMILINFSNPTKMFLDQFHFCVLED